MVTFHVCAPHFLSLVPNVLTANLVTFTMPAASPAIITLAQLDDRYFSELAGSSRFTLDFKLFKRGEQKVLVNSSRATFYGRSVNAEIDLEEGDYVVHVRIDREPFRSKVSFVDVSVDMCCAFVFSGLGLDVMEVMIKVYLLGLC